MDETIRVEKPAILEEIPLDRSSVIEASAGTGKTYTLEHLIVELVLEKGLSVTNILVVTFTEKATAELMERVRGILRRLVETEEGNANPGGPHWEIGEAERLRLRDALFSFGRAPIHTIHGFCQRVLVEHAFSNHRPFDQEHAEFDELFEEVFRAALREDFSEGEVRPVVLEAYVRANSVDELEEVLQEAVEARDRIEPRENFERAAERLEQIEPVISRLGESLDQMRRIFEEVDDEGGLNGNRRRKARSQLTGLNAAVEAYRRDGFAGFWSIVVSECDADDPFGYLADPSLFNNSHRDRFRDEWIAVLEELSDFDFQPLPLVLDGFVPVLKERLEAYKSEHGVFTYDDMLDHVWRAVRDGDELVETLREEYEFALVDEFQDTDPVQWKIFERIFDESAGRNPCALIGDPKQAIYGFRGADVRTYQKAKEKVTGRGDGGERGAAPIRLDHNYRSTPALIDAYNRIFEDLDDREGDADDGFFTGSVSYESPVEAGLPEKTCVDGEGREVEPIAVTSVGADGEGEVSSRGYSGAVFRDWSRELAEMLGGRDRDRIRISDDDGTEFREVEASDVFVLTRTKSEGDAFAEYLRARGVPYAFYKRDGLFQTPEARDWYDLLHAVERPGDRSRRLKAWATPFFGLDLGEADRADEWVDENHELTERLEAWHRYGRRGRIGQLVHSVLDRSGLLRRELFERHGRRELTNYEHIGESLVDWAQSDDLGLGDIVTRLGRYVDGESEPEGEEANLQRLETDEEAVQILTMHKAKGLSAPVVFAFPGYHHGGHGPHRYYDEEGARVAYLGRKRSSGASDAIDAYREREDERLLYVAITRAEGRLYLPYIEADTRNWRASRARGPGGPLFERFDELLDGGEAAPEGYEVRRRKPDPSPPEPSEPRDESASAEYGAALGEVATSRATAPLPDDEAFGTRRANRRLFVESYSSIDHWRESDEEESDALELDERVEATGEDEVEAAVSDELPLGRRTGLCVHEILEDLDYDEALGADGIDEWRERPAVAEVFDTISARFGMGSERQGLEELAWRALRAPVQLGELELASIAATDRQSKELEFWYPIPGETGATLEELVERQRLGGGGPGEGYLRGYIDLVFEAGGRVYAADWKTNWRQGDDAYSPADVEAAVEDHYRIQELFYATATARLVARAVDDVDEFERRYGGILYLLVRGMEFGVEKPTPGVYFRRPDFEELVEWEQRAGELVEAKLDDKRAAIALGTHDRWRV